MAHLQCPNKCGPTMFTREVDSNLPIELCTLCKWFVYAKWSDVVQGNASVIHESGDAESRARDSEAKIKGLEEAIRLREINELEWELKFWRERRNHASTKIEETKRKLEDVKARSRGEKE